MTSAQGPLDLRAPARDRRGLHQDAASRRARRSPSAASGPADLPKGYYVEPTIFIDVKNSMKIAQEEIFGPVLVVIRYKNIDDAIRIANDSIYGLGGAVWSRDNDKAMEVAKQVRTGTMWINDYHMLSRGGAVRRLQAERHRARVRPRGHPRVHADQAHPRRPGRQPRRQVLVRRALRGVSPCDVFTDAALDVRQSRPRGAGRRPLVFVFGEGCCEGTAPHLFANHTSGPPSRGRTRGRGAGARRRPHARALRRAACRHRRRGGPARRRLLGRGRAGLPLRHADRDGMRGRGLIIWVAVLTAVAVAGHALRTRLGLEPSVESLRATVDALGWRGPVIFFALVVFRQALALPAALVLPVGGLCFGAGFGTLLGALGIIVSGVMKFSIARWLGRDWMRRRLGEPFQRFERRIERMGPAVIALSTAHPLGILSPFHWAAGLLLAPSRFLRTGAAAGRAGPRLRLLGVRSDAGRHGFGRVPLGGARPHAGRPRAAGRPGDPAPSAVRRVSR